jgi:hypothetical protein
MDPRPGIGALAVVALMAASPASAQSNAKPAVGTVIGVQSGVNACRPGDRNCRSTRARSRGFDLLYRAEYRWVLVGGVATGALTRSAIRSRSNPSSP